MEVETIYSDQEVDATSSEEEEEKVEEPRKKNKNKKQKTLFDDLTENEPNENSSSWDFTQAIQILKNEKSNSKQTTLDEKIRRAVEGRKMKESKEYEAVDHKEKPKQRSLIVFEIKPNDRTNAYQSFLYQCHHPKRPH